MGVNGQVNSYGRGERVIRGRIGHTLRHIVVSVFSEQTRGQRGHCGRGHRLGPVKAQSTKDGRGVGVSQMLVWA